MELSSLGELLSVVQVLVDKMEEVLDEMEIEGMVITAEEEVERSGSGGSDCSKFSTSNGFDSEREVKYSS